MKWYYEKDKTAPLISAKDHIKSHHGNKDFPNLPDKMIIFCLSYAINYLQENYEVIELGNLPGFITKSVVYQIKGYDNIAFVYGGTGAPSIADVIETCHALGSKAFILIGLCGTFESKVNIGDLILPNKCLSEEGTSRHYSKIKDFVSPNHLINQLSIYEHYQHHGFTTYIAPIVSTDAIYRQTYFKESLWRSLGCYGVDMEASAFTTICNYYHLKSTILLLVSDKHPMENEKQIWTFGDTAFHQKRLEFIKTSIEYFLNN